MSNRISSRRVFAGPREALGLGRIVEGYVMDFIALVKPFDNFERPDLSSAIGRVEEIRFHPK